MGRPHPSLIRHLGCWAIYAFCTIFCLIVTGGAHAAEAARTKRVLIISTGSRLSPGFALVDQVYSKHWERSRRHGSKPTPKISISFDSQQNVLSEFSVSI